MSKPSKSTLNKGNPAEKMSNHHHQTPIEEIHIVFSALLSKIQLLQIQNQHLNLKNQKEKAQNYQLPIMLDPQNDDIYPYLCQLAHTIATTHINNLQFRQQNHTHNQNNHTIILKTYIATLALTAVAAWDSLLHKNPTANYIPVLDPEDTHSLPYVSTAVFAALNVNIAQLPSPLWSPLHIACLRAISHEAAFNWLQSQSQHLNLPPEQSLNTISELFRASQLVPISSSSSSPNLSMKYLENILPPVVAAVSSGLLISSTNSPRNFIQAIISTVYPVVSAIAGANLALSDSDVIKLACSEIENQLRFEPAPNPSPSLASSSHSRRSSQNSTSRCSSSSSSFSRHSTDEAYHDEEGYFYSSDHDDSSDDFSSSVSSSSSTKNDSSLWSDCEATFEDKIQQSFLIPTATGTRKKPCLKWDQMGSKHRVKLANHVGVLSEALYQLSIPKQTGKKSKAATAAASKPEDLIQQKQKLVLDKMGVPLSSDSEPETTPEEALSDSAMQLLRALLRRRSDHVVAMSSSGTHGNNAALCDLLSTVDSVGEDDLSSFSYLKAFEDFLRESYYLSEHKASIESSFAPNDSNNTTTDDQLLFLMMMLQQQQQLNHGEFHVEEGDELESSSFVSSSLNSVRNIVENWIAEQRISFNEGWNLLASIEQKRLEQQQLD